MKNLAHNDATFMYMFSVYTMITHIVVYIPTDGHSCIDSLANSSELGSDCADAVTDGSSLAASLTVVGLLHCVTHIELSSSSQRLVRWLVAKYV